MRDAVWNFTRLRCQEGAILPWWALAIRWVLYPLDSFYWHMNKTRGYQADFDAWIINGAWFQLKSLYELAHSKGEIYRVDRVGGTVVVEKLSPDFQEAVLNWLRESLR